MSIRLAVIVAYFFPYSASNTEARKMKYKYIELYLKRTQRQRER